MTYTLSYRINNSDLRDPVRAVDVHASPEQIGQLIECGYLVRERLIQGQLLDELRAAVDELAEREGARQRVVADGARRFGGLFVRTLHDKHPAFLKMLTFEPTLGVARAVLGPQVQIHAMVMRVTYPGAEGQETHWHFHQRVFPDPMPPWFARPRVLDNLIYLDDIDEATGPLCVVPGSHNDAHTVLEGDRYDDIPGQVKLCVPAGSCVTADAGLWHRAMPTRADGRYRRLVIIGYSPTWMKQIDKPGEGLTQSLSPNADLETRELLGLSGWY